MLMDIYKHFLLKGSYHLICLAYTSYLSLHLSFLLFISIEATILLKMSVCVKGIGVNVIVSAPIQDIRLNLLVSISNVMEHIQL